MWPTVTITNHYRTNFFITVKWRWPIYVVEHKTEILGIGRKKIKSNVVKILNNLKTISKVITIFPKTKDHIQEMKRNWKKAVKKGAHSAYVYLVCGYHYHMNRFLNILWRGQRRSNKIGLSSFLLDSESVSHGLHWNKFYFKYIDCIIFSIFSLLLYK